jgi:YfiR/HmsC-like
VDARRALFFLLLAVLPAAWAQTPAAELKAQVLVKVLLFVEWPAGALTQGQALHICLTEDGALAQQLLKVDGQQIQERTLSVRLMPRGVRQFAGCHVILLGAAGGTAPPGSLLVSEEAAALERGAMLSLLVEDGRVVFDVELESARRAGIGFSARLLRLARFVRKP